MSDLVLVTGGSGYIGALVVDELLAAGRRVRVLDVLLHGQEASRSSAGTSGMRTLARSRSRASMPWSISPPSSATLPVRATPRWHTT
jgi:nucleoside-diphosphate-sugar epimerase